MRCFILLPKLYLLGDIDREFPVGEDAESEAYEEDDEENTVLPGGGEVVGREGFFGEVNDECHRIDEDDLLDICREHLERIDDRRRIEKHCEEDLPD